MLIAQVPDLGDVHIQAVKVLANCIDITGGVRFGENRPLTLAIEPILCGLD